MPASATPASAASHPAFFTDSRGLGPPVTASTRNIPRAGSCHPLELPRLGGDVGLQHGGGVERGRRGAFRSRAGFFLCGCAFAAGFALGGKFRSRRSDHHGGHEDRTEDRPRGGTAAFHLGAYQPRRWLGSSERLGTFRACREWGAISPKPRSAACTLVHAAAECVARVTMLAAKAQAVRTICLHAML